MSHTIKELFVTFTREEHWVISIPNPFESAEETELARFEQDNAIVRKAVAATVVSLAESLDAEIIVQSHSKGHVTSVQEYIAKNAKALGYSFQKERA